MPKVASRIWLEVVSVKVERLQDITEEDARAEGVESKEHLFKDGRMVYRDYEVAGNSLYNTIPEVYNNARGSFFSLWISINGLISYTENPWVWVIEFKKTNKPK